MGKIEKIKRVLTKEAIKKNIPTVSSVNKIVFKHRSEIAHRGTDEFVDILYVLEINEEANKKIKKIKVKTTIDLEKLYVVDPNKEIDVLIELAFNQINELKDEIESIVSLDKQVEEKLLK